MQDHMADPAKKSNRVRFKLTQEEYAKVLVEKREEILRRMGETKMLKNIDAAHHDSKEIKSYAYEYGGTVEKMMEAIDSAISEIENLEHMTALIGLFGKDVMEAQVLKSMLENVKAVAHMHLEHAPRIYSV